MEAGAGAFGLNEDAICVYADLDTLIEACDMPDGQRDTIMMIMDGYTLSDVASLHDIAYNTVLEQYRNAVLRIVDHSKARWAAVYHQG